MSTGTTRTPAARRRPPRPYSSPACFAHELETADVRIKRVYDPPEPEDGWRVLVDRLWPRGLTKRRAALDAWAKELSPSAALRKWFGHDPRRMTRFAARYRAELQEHETQLHALRARAVRERVTLLYAARDPKINHAAVLRELILGLE